MKLFLTLLVSMIIYFGLIYFGATSLVIWIVLIVLWTLIDYVTYNNPFSWKDYIILAIVLSVVEIGAEYNYFGLF
ncbi:hypothetical protein OAT18_02650 [Tenacibaculum sp.]|nr:hypothetical protein [Tenacibaculum sp.]